MPIPERTSSHDPSAPRRARTQGDETELSGRRASPRSAQCDAGRPTRAGSAGAHRQASGRREGGPAVPAPGLLAGTPFFAQRHQARCAALPLVTCRTLGIRPAAVVSPFSCRGHPLLNSGPESQRGDASNSGVPARSCKAGCLGVTLEAPQHQFVNFLKTLGKLCTELGICF